MSSLPGLRHAAGECGQTERGMKTSTRRWVITLAAITGGAVTLGCVGAWGSVLLGHWGPAEEVTRERRPPDSAYLDEFPMTVDVVLNQRQFTLSIGRNWYMTDESIMLSISTERWETAESLITIRYEIFDKNNHKVYYGGQTPIILVEKRDEGDSVFQSVIDVTPAPQSRGWYHPLDRGWHRLEVEVTQAGVSVRTAVYFLVSRA